MKDKDHKQLEKIYESMTQYDLYDQALANPKDFELVLHTVKVDDYDGNETDHTVATVYSKADSNKYYYENSYDGVDALRNAFEEQNPEGINDQR